MAGPDAAFWQNKFDEGVTPWDRGGVNPQLSRWIDAGALAPCRVLVPGCGSGHEVAEFARGGFEVTGLDYTQAAIDRTRENLRALPEAARQRATLVLADALHWTDSRPFDVVYEQTCLCAIHPDHWRAYADQVTRWLGIGGRLFALFVQAPKPGAAQGLVQGPPYHCDIHGMRALFPSGHWSWPKPPYVRNEHPGGMVELPVVLTRLA